MLDNQYIDVKIRTEENTTDFYVTPIVNLFDGEGYNLQMRKSKHWCGVYHTHSDT